MFIIWLNSEEFAFYRDEIGADFNYFFTVDVRTKQHHQRSKQKMPGIISQVLILIARD